MVIFWCISVVNINAVTPCGLKGNGMDITEEVEIKKKEEDEIDCYP